MIFLNYLPLALLTLFHLLSLFKDIHLVTRKSRGYTKPKYMIYMYFHFWNQDVPFLSCIKSYHFFFIFVEVKKFLVCCQFCRLAKTPIILLQNFFFVWPGIFFSVDLLESICYAEITDIHDRDYVLDITLALKIFFLFACIWTNPRYCDHFLLCSPYGASSMNKDKCC